MTVTLPATYPTWLFDGSPIDDPLGHGERAVRFIRSLRHPKSATGFFQLDPWMERIVRRIYGPRNPEGTRIVKTALILIPRGNRKTTLGAALSLLHLIGPERVSGGQIVAAAADQKQARIAFEEAANIIGADRTAQRFAEVRDYRNRIHARTNGSIFEALSSDGATQHGRTPTFALLDELHAWKKRDLYEAIRTGLVKTRNSLQVIISTAGRGQENIGFESYDYARRVAIGEIEDPTWLPVIFETPADADWLDEEWWKLVNPGLAYTPPYPDLAGLRQLAREAMQRPYDRESFRQLNLNVWLDGSADPFVEMSVYDQGATELDEERLRSMPAWIAVDASVTTDLSAVVTCWRDEDDTLYVRPSFFVPGDALRVRADRDQVPYPAWAEAGHITPTPGNVVDYVAIEDHIRELCRRYDVQEVAFDPAYSRQISLPLANDGFPVVEMRQGWRTMGPAIKDLERAIIGGKFKHDGNPCLRWNFENIAIQTDSAGNISFHKGKSRDRIDGAVASAMAVARAMSGDYTKSLFDDPNLNIDNFIIH